MSDQFDVLAYYKELYEKEMEFSNRLNEKIGTSITMLSIIGSGHVLLVSEMFPMVWPFNVWNWIAITFVGLSIIAFVITLVKFRNAYSKYTYGHFPIAKMDATIEHGRQMDMNDEASKEIRRRLTNQYRDGAIHNRKVNIRKSKNHYLLNRTIMVAFVALAVTFVLWFALLKSNVTQIQQQPELKVQLQYQERSKEDAPADSQNFPLPVPSPALAATQYVDTYDDP